MRFLALLFVLGACLPTKRNPAVCCETDVECGAVGFDSPEPCAEGVCFANTCQADGCDGDEDCRDPAAPTCVTGRCRNLDCENAGGEVLFLSNKDGDDDVYVANADGSSARALTSSAGSEQSPRWSPDGTRFAFIAPVAGGADIFVATRVGGTLNVTNTSEIENRFEWAPDGSHLAFDAGTPSRVRVVRVDGTGGLTIRSEQDSVSERLPTWAPDSTKLAYRAESMMGAVRIWQGGIDGTASTPLTTPQPIADLKWSPNGLKIAAISNQALWVMDLGTGLFLQQIDQVLEFAWAPDSSTFVFVREETGNRDVWTADADGQGQRNLTSNPAIDEHPRWSPDGADLIFETMRDGNREIYRMSRDGSDPTNLSNDSAAQSQPDWVGCSTTGL